MKKITKRAVSSLVLLVLTLSIILGSLSSCKLLYYVAETKEEITENISASLENDGTKNKYVSDYLRYWGFPLFDRIKIVVFEECFKSEYNYEGGMPKTLTHAVETAELFLEHYYDKLELSDKTAVTDSLLYCYVAALDDPYAIYRPPVESEEYSEDMSGSFGGIGVTVQYNDTDESIMINTVYSGSPAEKAGIKEGDFIYAIDGKTVKELGYTNAVNHVRGKIGTSVELTLIRNGEYVTVTAIRAKVEEVNVECTIDKENNVAYVRIVAFKGNTYSQFVKAIDELEEAKVDGIIFDLRGNPGGYLASVCDVLSYILPTDKILVSYRYSNRDTVVLKSTDDEGGDHVLTLPFTIICNEYTASAGEIFTAALRDYRNDKLLSATIVGTTTYKKGIMQNTYYYTDGSSVTMTVSYYDPPCGVNYHGIGVTPDVYVENAADEDLQLKTAYDELFKLINDN